MDEGNSDFTPDINPSTARNDGSQQDHTLTMVASIMTSPSPSTFSPSINITPSHPHASSEPDSSHPDTFSTPSNTSTRTRSSSLLHRNILTRMRPLPFQYVFSLWHTNPRTTSDPTCLSDSIPDIATFYKIYNNFPWSSLAPKDSVSFFRAGVKPLWEDAENIQGGCWTIKARKDEGRALRTWEELCLMVCGGELQSVVAKERDHILGLSYSPRLYHAHISIWTKFGSNTSSIDALQRTILSRLSSDLQPASETEYYFKKHSEHDGWEEAVRPRGRERMMRIGEDEEREQGKE